MATVVTRVYVIPPTLSSVYPTSTLLTEAEDILFYLKGGSNIVSIEKTSRDNFNVMVPIFSKIDGSKLRDIIVPLRDDIENAMDSLQIPQRKSFLFDVKAKIVLQSESFLQFIPYWSTADALFIFNNDIVPPYDIRAHYLSDNGAFIQLQALMVFISKMNLSRPLKGDWTLSGKKLLAFLASKEYNKPYDFLTDKGPWDVLKLSSKSNRRRGSVDIANMSQERLERITSLAMRILDDSVGFQDLPLLMDGEDPGTISLSDLMELGIDSLISTMPVPSIDVTIDVNKDVFKAVILDRSSGSCLVQLVPGVMRTDEWFKEALETDNIILIENDLIEPPDL